MIEQTNTSACQKDWNATTRLLDFMKAAGTADNQLHSGVWQPGAGLMGGAKYRKANIHFSRSASGVVTDRQTGLQWCAGPDGGTNWYDASAFATGLGVGGGGWRMPTIEELRGIYQPGLGARNMSPLFMTTGWHVWSGDSCALSSAESSLLFHFYNGDVFCVDRIDNDQCRYLSRAFAVRQGRDG